MPDINYPSLKTFQFNPVNNLQFATITPQVEDPNILRTSITQANTARVEASKAKTQYEMSLGKAKASLNPNDIQWFEDNIEKKAKDEIAKIVDSGYYGDLQLKINDLAESLANNNSFIGRVRANAEYEQRLKEEKDRVTRGEVDEITFNRWKEQNDYKYNPSYLANGQESIGSLADMDVIYDDFDFEKEFLKSAQEVEYEQTSTAGGGPTEKLADALNKKGTNTGDMSLVSPVQPTANTPTIIGYQKGSNSRQRKQSAKIIENFRQKLKTGSNIMRLQQKFQDTIWQLEKLQEKYDSLSYDDPKKQELANTIKEYKKSALTYNNQTIGADGFEKWLELNIEKSAYAANLAYDRTATSSEYAESVNPLYGRGGRGTGDDAHNIVNRRPQTLQEGPGVETSVNYGSNSNYFASFRRMYIDIFTPNSDNNSNSNNNGTN